MPSNNTPSQHHYNKSLHRREFDVFSPDGLICYTVPAGRIAHYGDEGKRMMVCRNYASGGTCPMGSHCKFVHIDVPLSSLRSEAIHTHFVWRDPSLVTYERLAQSMAKGRTDLTEERAAETQLTIYGPNNRAPAEQVRAGDLLLTVGAERAFAIAMGEREVDTTKASPHPCHCAHYYFNQVCNRGAGCGFVHVISLNPKQAEARVRHSNFHKRLEAMGCHNVPHREEHEDDREEAIEAKEPAEDIKPTPRKTNSKASSTLKPIRIPKGATIRPASPVAGAAPTSIVTTAAPVVSSRRHSRTVSLSFERNSAGASFDDVTVISGMQDLNDPALHGLPSSAPTVHVGMLPAPQQGPLSVVVGVRAPTPSGFCGTASQTTTAPISNGPPTNGPLLLPIQQQVFGGHERRVSEQEIPMPSQINTTHANGQFPIRISLPVSTGPHHHQGNVTFSNNTAHDPLLFPYPSTNYSGGQPPTEDNRHLTGSANISRRPSNVVDGVVHVNSWNRACNPQGFDRQEGTEYDGALGGVDPQTTGSGNNCNFDEGSFRSGNRLNTNAAPIPPNNFQSIPVVSAATSTNNSFAFTTNSQVPFVTPSSTNTNTAPTYALSIGDIRFEKPKFDNGFDINLLQQRDSGCVEGDDSVSRPSNNGFPQPLQLMHLQQDARSASTPATGGSHTPTPKISQFPNPHNNYTTEAMRFTNLRHSRNATNASESGASNAYNYSNSQQPYINSNTAFNQQRSHARQGSLGTELNNNAHGSSDFAMSAAATPNKITTSPGRYAHNPYGGGNTSLGGSILGSSLAKDRDSAPLGDPTHSIAL